eukprot:c5711_g1_i1 orf=123-536(+)
MQQETVCSLCTLQPAHPPKYKNSKINDMPDLISSNAYCNGAQDSLARSSSPRPPLQKAFDKPGLITSNAQSNEAQELLAGSSSPSSSSTGSLQTEEQVSCGLEKLAKFPGDVEEEEEKEKAVKRRGKVKLLKQRKEG